MEKRKSVEKMRIVSLAPSATSILCAVGAKSALVGVTKWCPLVAPVDGLPKLGDCWSLDASAVVKLEPTLVIGSVPYKQETVAKLLEYPVTFLAMNPRTLADVRRDIQMLARLVDCAKEGERVVAWMKKEFQKIAKRTRPGAPRPRVYCEAWPNPRISSPPWVAELVTLAGGKMIVPPGKRVSEEQVAEARPDVVVLAWAATADKPDPRKTCELAAWRDVPAVGERRVHVVRDELLNTPGPPLVEGAQELYRIFHGNPARRAGS